MPLRFRRPVLGVASLAVLSLPACSPPPAAPVAVGASPKLAWAYPTGP